MWGFVSKLLANVLIAGFEKWLANLTARREGALQQTVDNQKAQDKENEEVRQIKNTVRTDSDARDRVRDYFADPNE